MKKILLKMLVVVLLMFVGLLTALGSQAQALNNKVSLSFRNAEIKTILNGIKDQTGYDFVYNTNEIDSQQRVNVDVKNTDLETALQKCFHPLGINFTIKDKIIVLQRSSPQSPLTGTKQRKIIKGQVRDSFGDTLPGVSVQIKGTTQGIATDADGKFTISVPEGENPILVFSYIGMKTQTVSVIDDKELKIVMEESAEMLSEVVATGMQVINREQMTGSASVITAKELANQGITSVDRILGGMIPGLNATTLSGAPGVRAQITIRGENSLNGNTEPLWIVDGLPLLTGVPRNNSGNYAATIMQDGVGNIMPEDIESISILKDASAAAIYGARAANGVIVITTKKGFRSKTQVAYTGNFNVGLSPNVNLDMMNSSEKLQYEKSIIDHFGLNYAWVTGRGSLIQKQMQGFLTKEEYNNEMKRLASINTNWFKEIFRPSFSQSHNISLRGGSEELNYYTSITYKNENGILMENTNQNAGVLMKIDYRPTSKLIFNLGLTGNILKNADHASAIDPFKYAVFANPYERSFNEDGSYAADLSYLNNNYTSSTPSGYVYDRLNIIRELRENRQTRSGLDGSISLDIKYEPIVGLIFSANMRRSVAYNQSLREVNGGTYSSYITESLANKAFNNPPILPVQYDNGELGEAGGKSNSWVVRPQIDYSFALKKDHLFSVLASMEISSRKFNNFGYTSPIYFADYRITGLPTFPDTELTYDKLRTILANAYTTSDGQDRSLSYIGSFRYSFKDRYVANINLRADGADVIGNKNQFTPLGSVGLRYNVHNEKFFKNDIVSELAIRASYGYTGSINRSAYPFSVMEIGNLMYQGNRFLIEYQYPNPTVKWERKTDRNLGLDISFLKNRINFVVDYYSNRTDDVLTNLAIPVSTGREEVYANGGVVSNKGLELMLNVKWIDTRNITFSTRVNIASNSNKILRSRHDFDSYKQLIHSDVISGGVYDIVGQETKGIYGWKDAGVDPQTGNPMYYLTEEGKAAYREFLKGYDNLSDSKKEHYASILPSLTDVPDAVMYDYPDMKDTWQMPSMQYLGRLNPKYTGGFNTYFKYKNIEFTTDWMFKAGHMVPTFNDYQNAPRNLAATMPEFREVGYTGNLAVSGTNRQRKYLAYWQMAGDKTNVSRFITDDRDLWASMMTDKKYEKGDFLRMTNLSVSYRVNPKLIERYHLRNLSVALNVSNLLTFTHYKGIDVTTGNAFAYPTPREFNIKLQVGF
ncbi:MAG: SusC/RagA family TonB-linked outer membrane protein [Bacteroidia bacterium]|nr:SusC/RagA family TonB-linked outer membrane protein [Bacteroidia bacterium]